MGVSTAEAINSKPGSARDREIVSADVIVTCPARNFVTLKIVTRSGVTGIGDATLNGRELAVASYLKEHVVPNLIGNALHEPDELDFELFTVGGAPGCDLGDRAREQHDCA